MPETNYRLLMEREIKKARAEGRQPSLLLHVCCAPCSSGCLEELCETFRVTCYYDNPNIAPREEFERRAEELERLLKLMPLRLPPGLCVADYTPDRFYEIARGLEALPEGGERCFRCYRLRLSDTAQKARDEGFDYFTTTLSISPLKNAGKLNQIGAELAERYGVAYLFSDFKKKDGYLRSIRNSKEYGLYRQDYCGCVYSKAQAEERRKRRGQSPEEDGRTV